MKPTSLRVLRAHLRDLHPAWWLLPFAAVAIAFGWPRSWGEQRLEDVAYDQRLRTFTPTPETSPHFLIVQLDDQTLYGIAAKPEYHAKYGNFPFSRTLWYDVGDRLLSLGAKAVVMDVLIDQESSDRESDDTLRAWFAKTHPPVYLAYTASTSGVELPHVAPVNRMPAEKYVSPGDDVLSALPADDGTGIAGDAAAGDDTGIAGDEPTTRTAAQKHAAANDDTGIAGDEPTTRTAAQKHAAANDNTGIAGDEPTSRTAAQKHAAANDDTGIAGTDAAAASTDDDPFGGPVARALLAARALAFPVTLSGIGPTAIRASFADPNASLIRPDPPIPHLLEHGVGFGLTLHEEDADGVMRRTHFVFSDGKNDYVTLAVAVAADVLHASSASLSPGRLTLGSRSLAVDPDGSAELDYGGAVGPHYPTVSLIALLDDRARAREHGATHLDPALFRDKIVFIAGSSAATFDLKSTPFESRASGVFKVVSELDSLLYGQFITHAPSGAAPLLSLGLCLLCALLIWSTGSIWAEVLAPFGALAGLFVLTGELLARGHLHLAFARPSLAILLTCGGAIVAHRLSASRDRERVKAIFSRFVAPQVVEQLVSQPTLPRLDGEEREITAFFSDIKGFSSFSEQLKSDPRKLVRILNTYLTRVSGVLQKHGGCLDKYIGDAVVCIFGAPLHMEDHAIRACRAALEVQKEIALLRAEFRAQGLPDVYTRIGMNSAVMFVGNFGSEQLFNYTAMGDGMNLASRLEGANKPYGSLIMIGPRTYELARDHVEVRELDAVRVAGKSEPVTVYELLANKGELPELKRRVVERYAQALAAFRQARFAEAAVILEEALAIDPGDPPSKALLGRAREYAAEPPARFDGITQLEK